MAGPVPHDQRTCRRDGVELRLLELAMEVMVIPPCEQQLAGILHPRGGLGQPLDVVRVSFGGLRRALWQYPVLDGDDLRGHRQRRQQWMVVLGNEAGHDHLARERLVDAVRLRPHRHLQIVQRARREDPVADDGHGLRGGPRRVERDNLSGGVDHSLGQSERCGLRQVLQGWRLRERRRRHQRDNHCPGGRCRRPLPHLSLHATDPAMERRKVLQSPPRTASASRSGTARTSWGSRQERLHHLAVHVGQAEVAALER